MGPRGGTVYVSRSDYHPLLIDSSAYGGERISFETYDYLPASPPNVAQLRFNRG